MRTQTSGFRPPDATGGRVQTGPAARASLYADILLTVRHGCEEAARTFPAVGGAPHPAGPPGEGLTALAERAVAMGMVPVGAELYQWEAATRRFDRALHCLDEFRDNHRAMDRDVYQRVLRRRMALVRAARAELEREGRVIIESVLADMAAHLAA